MKLVKNSKLGMVNENNRNKNKASKNSIKYIVNV